MKVIFSCLVFSVSIYFAQAQVSHKIALFDLLNDSVYLNEVGNKYTYFNEIDSVISANNYNLIFNKPAAVHLLNYIKNTESWGFNIEKYKYNELQGLFNSRDVKQKAIFQILATQTYLKLYKDILNGLLISDNERGKDIHLELSSFEVDKVLHTLIRTQANFIFSQAESSETAYLALKNQLEYYYYNDSIIDVYNVAFTDTLQIGDRDSVILNLRKKLYYLGDLKSNHKFRSSIFDYDLKMALQQFQKRNLLKENGILDAKTINKLNTPIQDLITELQLNLERWRWLPQNLGYYYAFANLPAFEMSLVKNDSLLLRQNIVCGKVSRNTPVFSDTMVYMDVNPTWTVPPTILQNDILPAVRRSSTYLSRTNMKVLDISTGKYVSGAEINWANSKNYRFIQGPGLSNSLGVVKFIFPNKYYIFFHDTPHKEHFPLPSRAFSSGCVRLAQPIEFAEALLTSNIVPYNTTQIDSIVSSQKTKRILLNEQPFVYINYITQEFKNGVIYNYPDIYKYNGALRQEFEKKNKIVI